MSKKWPQKCLEHKRGKTQEKHLDHDLFHIVIPNLLFIFIHLKVLSNLFKQSDCKS